MTTIEPTGQILGATVRGVDLAEPLGDDDFATIVHGARPSRRAALPGAAARGRRAA